MSDVVSGPKCSMPEIRESKNIFLKSFNFFRHNVKGVCYRTYVIEYNDIKCHFVSSQKLTNRTLERAHDAKCFANVFSAMCDSDKNKEAGNILAKMDENVAGNILAKMDENVAGNIFAKMDGYAAGNILAKMDENVAGNILAKMDENVAGNILENMDKYVAGNILAKMDENVAGNILAKMDENVAGNILANMDRDVADNIRAEMQNVKETKDKVDNMLKEMSNSNLDGTAGAVASILAKMNKYVAGNILEEMNGDVAANILAAMREADPGAYELLCSVMKRIDEEQK